MREKNQLLVEYALGGSTQPISVADWETQLTRSLPEELSASLPSIEEIERELGSKKHRERDGSYVDRLIDIDLLDYDGLVLDTHSLVLPHPYMHKRTFVMTPLAEIAPQWVHPVLGKTATELLEGLRNEK